MSRLFSAITFSLFSYIDPPVCPLNSHVMHSPCSSSSSTSSRSSVWATSSSYVATSSSYVVTSLSYIITSSNHLTLSVLGSHVLKSTVEAVILASSKASSTNKSSTLDISESLPTVMSLTNVLNVVSAITTAKRSSSEASHPTPFVTLKSYHVTLSFPVSQVSKSIMETVFSNSSLTIMSSRFNSISMTARTSAKRSISEASKPTPLGSLTSNHMTLSLPGGHERSFSEASHPTPLVTLMSHQVTLSFPGSRVSKSIMETVVSNPYLTNSTPSSLIHAGNVVTTTTDKKSFLASSNPTPSLTPMSHQMSLSTHDTHLSKTVMATSLPSPSLTGTLAASSIKGIVKIRPLIEFQ